MNYLQVLALFSCLMSRMCIASSTMSSQHRTSMTSISEQVSATPTATMLPGCLPPVSARLPLSQTKHTVTVGARGRLAFDPDRVNAEIGDLVQFNFLALNHTLTQSSLSDPCTADKGGFSTGFKQFNPKNISTKFVVQYTVTDLDPRWFFCTQTNNISHCHAGMTFALNPARPSALLSNQTLTSFPSVKHTESGLLATSAIPSGSASHTTTPPDFLQATPLTSTFNWNSSSQTFGPPTSSTTSTSKGTRVAASLFVGLGCLFAIWF